MSKLKFAALLLFASACTLTGLARGEEPVGHILQSLAPARQPAAASAPARLPQPVGHVLWLFGQVERIGADGIAKPLAKGDTVFEGDVIRSASGSHAQLIMSDEALLAVRAQSSVKLTQYSYQGVEDGTERAVIELLKGGLRSVSGTIGRSNKDAYQLKTKMHVIGIRGTDHETFATDAGTFNRVTLGGTYLEGAGGRVDLAPGEAGFASSVAEAAPTRLTRTPEFMHLTALSRANSGPRPRGPTTDDERRLQKNAVSSNLRLPTKPVLPAQALGDKRGWGKGSRCEGPCADPLRKSN